MALYHVPDLTKCRTVERMLLHNRIAPRHGNEAGSAMRGRHVGRASERIADACGQGTRAEPSSQDVLPKKRPYQHLQDQPKDEADLQRYSHLDGGNEGHHPRHPGRQAESESQNAGDHGQNREHEKMEAPAQSRADQHHEHEKVRHLHFQICDSEPGQFNVTTAPSVSHQVDNGYGEAAASKNAPGFVDNSLLKTRAVTRIGTRQIFLSRADRAHGRMHKHRSHREKNSQPHAGLGAP